MKVILASGSPRRRELMEMWEYGVRFRLQGRKKL